MALYRAYFKLTASDGATHSYHVWKGPKVTWEFWKVEDYNNRIVDSISFIPSYARHISSNITMGYVNLRSGTSCYINPKSNSPSAIFWGNDDASTIVKGDMSTFFSWFLEKTSGSFRFVPENAAYDEDDPAVVTISGHGTLVIQYEDYYGASTGVLSTTQVNLNPANPQSVYMTITNGCEEEHRAEVYHTITWSIPSPNFANYSNTQIVDASASEVFITESYSPPVTFVKDYMKSTSDVVMNVQLVTLLSATSAQVGNAQNMTINLHVDDSIVPTFGTGGENGLIITRFHDQDLDLLLSSNHVQEEDIGCVQNHDSVTILSANAQGIYESTITDYVFTISGRSYTQHITPLQVIDPISYEILVQNGQALSRDFANVYKIQPITSGYNITVTGYVVDTRGRKSATQTITIPVTAYSVPSFNEASSIRCDAEGTALETGGYARASMTATYSRLTVVQRDQYGNIDYDYDTTTGELVPRYHNLNTLEVMAYYGEPHTDGSVDPNGNLIYTYPWFTAEEYELTTYSVGDYCWHNGLMYICRTNIAVPEAWNSAHWLEVGTRIGTTLTPTTGSEVIGDGTQAHSTAVLFVANDWFTTRELDFNHQPNTIVFTTSSEYVIFFREGGTGIAFGQALESQEDNRFVVTDAWTMLHGENYIPTIIVSATAPINPPSSTSHALWIKPPSTQTSGSWNQCEVYYYIP